LVGVAFDDFVARARSGAFAPLLAGFFGWAFDPVFAELFLAVAVLPLDAFLFVFLELAASSATLTSRFLSVMYVAQDYPDLLQFPLQRYDLLE
jgi:hypothetical protein